MEEEWRAVVGYEGLYEVSDIGNVRSLIFRNGVTRRPYPIPKTLKLRPHPDGYFTVQLARDNAHRHYNVHRLVLEAFVGQCPPGMQAAHENGDPADNRPANLELWVKGQVAGQRLEDLLDFMVENYPDEVRRRL